MKALPGVRMRLWTAILETAAAGAWWFSLWIPVAARWHVLAFHSFRLGMAITYTAVGALMWAHYIAYRRVQRERYRQQAL